jgi:SAM-dependent methyltransferase
VGFSTFESPPGSDAFDATADFYDALTHHHDYDAWIDAIEALARRHGLKPRGTLLDIGCGTGKSILPWLTRGWSVVGCDRSSRMLARAAEKLGDRARLLVADGRELPAVGPFDLVTAIDDVVNYLEPIDVPALFASVTRNLAVDGLFVFDLNTTYVFRDFFGGIDVREHAGWVVVWRGCVTDDFAPGGVADAVADAFCARPDGAWERRTAHHREYHHPPAVVARWLKEAGLRPLAMAGQGYDGRFADALDEDEHTKCVVVACRDGAPDGRKGVRE